MASFIHPSFPSKISNSLTDRSRKFYDGTYKWDAEGFTDDKGVYRIYDCYDPAARAPTPLPPMLLGEDRDEESSKETVVSSHPLLHSGRNVRTDNRDAVPSSAENRGLKQVKQQYAGAADLLAKPKVVRFAADTGKDGLMSVRYEEMFQGHENSAQLVSKMEGVLAAIGYVGLDLSADECYRLCGFTVPPAPPTEAHPTAVPPSARPAKPSLTSWKSKQKDAALSKPQPSNSANSAMATPKQPTPSPISDLSACPSSLSGWNVLDKTKAQSATPTQSRPRSDTKDKAARLAVEAPKPKRGVAQVIRRTAKKAGPGWAMATAPSVLSLQADSVVRASTTASSRRSSRLLRRRET